jgi:predicted DNA-binding WGR domain protein
MSDWRVSLILVDESSRKFWRARVQDTKLYVNYGRIGTNGQTQLKTFGSTDDAEKELAKLEREKRKKGYHNDDGGASTADADVEADEEGEDEGEDEAPAKPAVKAVPKTAAPLVADLAFVEGGRKIDLRLAADGKRVRMVVVEQYESAEAAQRAFDKVRSSIEGEGYRAVTRNDDL